jgi:hypothetical protein
LAAVIVALVQLIRRVDDHEDLQIVATLWLAAHRRAQTSHLQAHDEPVGEQIR